MGDYHRYKRSGARRLLAIRGYRDRNRPGASFTGGLPRTQAAERGPFAERGTQVKSQARRLPVGAEVTGAGVHFRVWAPVRKTVEVVLDGGGTVALAAEHLGYFSGIAPNARAGSRYKYILDGGEACPDPASRFQPEGPHGWSEIIDATAHPSPYPAAFQWTDRSWHGIGLPHQVIYEM